LNRTFALVKGAVADPEATWRGFLPDADNWRKTTFLLTGPLIILAAVLGYIVGLLGSDASAFGFRPTIMSTLLTMVFGAIAAGLVAFIVSALAGMFGGKSSFALGLAATSLAFVPGYLGQVLGWLPWIGGLVLFGLFIYALVLLWRIIPIYLEVPAGKRVGHYLLTLIAAIVVMFLISMLLRPIIEPDMSGRGAFSDSHPGGIGGITGGAMRQAGTIELEVVESGDGSWAVHQWIREALRTAHYQRDTDEATAHNYKLFKKYEDQLAAFIAR
jgi:hypothetical protein